MNVNDILVWQCPDIPENVHRWRVIGIHLGTTGAESLIQCESLSHKPGWTGHWETHPMVFIPEVLTRNLKVEKP